MITGFTVMSIGDSVSQVQVLGADKYDVKRNLVSSCQNAALSPIYNVWFKFLDKKIPISHISGINNIPNLLLKTMVTQVVTTGLNNPVQLQYTNFMNRKISELVYEKRSEVSINAEYLEKVEKELGNLQLKGMVFWTPITFLTLGFVPSHLRVLFTSSCAVIWGGYQSHVANRPINEVLEDESQDEVDEAVDNLMEIFKDCKLNEGSDGSERKN